MGERILEFADTVQDRRGRAYGAHVEVDGREDGTWEARVVFSPVERGEPLSTAAETHQTDLSDVQYWAAGLTHAYLEGALERAQDEARLAGRGEWRDDEPQRTARFAVECADDRIPAELLGTFTVEPGVTRELPDGSVLRYVSTEYRGEDGSQRAHTFELCYRQRARAEQWLNERLNGLEAKFET